MSLRNFIVLDRVGRGTFGIVEKVRRISDQKLYAIKKVQISKLNQKSKNNALNEVRILASLQSPYIIRYQQAFFDETLDLLCVVMQYADGGDLSKIVLQYKKNNKKIDQQLIWKYFIDILYGIQTLHSHSILHRDIKLQNIFIVGQKVKIGDLNVSKVKKGLAQTQTGTPYYASPQVWNDMPYDEKSDIWSVGCLLYELTTLSPPFLGKNMHQLYLNVQKGKFKDIPNCYSQDLQQIIKLCLKINASERPTAHQLLNHFSILKRRQPLVISIIQPLSDHKKIFLKTIQMPKNKKQLKFNLPKSNYYQMQQNFEKQNNIQYQAKKNIKSEIEKSQSLKKRKSLPRTQRSLKRLKQLQNLKNNHPKNQESITSILKSKLSSNLQDKKQLKNSLDKYIKQTINKNQKEQLKKKKQLYNHSFQRMILLNRNFLSKKC